MSCVHVEPETLHEMARYIWQQRLLIQQELDSLRTALRRLEFAWQGADATEYILTMRRMIYATERQLDQLEHLGLTLYRQSERWQQSDETWRRTFHSLRFTSPPKLDE